MNPNQSFMHHNGRFNVAFAHPTSAELLYIKNGNCYLIRNIRKVKHNIFYCFHQLKLIVTLMLSVPQYRKKKISTSSVVSATLAAIISRLVASRTRDVTVAEHDDPTIEKTAKIAGILLEICDGISNYKGLSLDIVPRQIYSHYSSFIQKIVASTC